MKLPSKITSYRESVLSNFTPILDILIEKDATVSELYSATKRYFNELREFMDALDCLFALGKIAFDEESEVVHYVV